MKLFDMCDWEAGSILDITAFYKFMNRNWISKNLGVTGFVVTTMM